MTWTWRLSITACVYLSRSKTAQKAQGQFVSVADGPRRRVKAALAAQVRAIDYDNYKSGVADDAFHDALMDLWRAMADLQEVPPYGRTLGRELADRNHSRSLGLTSRMGQAVPCR